MMKNATTKPMVGESTSGTRTFCPSAFHLNAEKLACATTAPPSAPINACELDEGMPNHQVNRFQMQAPTRAASTTTWLTTAGSAKPEAMVFATAVPVMAPVKFKIAASSTAVRMGNTPVDTTVAMALAAS